MTKMVNRKTDDSASIGNLFLADENTVFIIFRSKYSRIPCGT